MAIVVTQPAPVKQAKERPPLLLDAYVRTVPPCAGHPGCHLLTLTSPGKRKGAVEVVPYLLSVNPIAEGAAYRLTKLQPTGGIAGDVYDVLLIEDDKDQPVDRCDCPGGSAHGRCKHALGLRQLQGEGSLPTV